VHALTLQYVDSIALNALLTWGGVFPETGYYMCHLGPSGKHYKLQKINDKVWHCW